MDKEHYQLLERGDILLLPFSHEEPEKIVSFLSSFFSLYSTRWEQKKSRLENESTPFSLDLPNIPLNGKRVLNVYTNLSSEETVWHLGEYFSTLLERYGGKEIPFPEYRDDTILSILTRRINPLSPYDRFLKKFTHLLKTVQDDFFKEEKRFPPFATWAYFSDSRLVKKKEHKKVLKTTFLLSKYALLNPELSPSSLLERASNEVVLLPERRVF